MGWGQPPSKQPGHVYKKLTWHEPDKKKKTEFLQKLTWKTHGSLTYLAKFFHDYSDRIRQDIPTKLSNSFLNVALNSNASDKIVPK